MSELDWKVNIIAVIIFSAVAVGYVSCPCTCRVNCTNYASFGVKTLNKSHVCNGTATGSVMKVFGGCTVLTSHRFIFFKCFFPHLR